MPPLRTGDLLGRTLALPGIGALLETSGDRPGPPLFLVGGAVRDLLLGRTPVDFDVAVEGPLSALGPLVGEVASSYPRFGTATLERDGVRVDLASTRKESYPVPGALPVVVPAEIAEDLARRDFTVNAIALRLSGAEAGELLGFPGALDDLRAGRLAVLHGRSFLDDPTRLLRLARYRSRLGFDVAAATLELAHEAIAAGARATVSGARIGHELRLLAAEDDPVAALRSLTDLEVDRTIHPDFGLHGDNDAGIARHALQLLPPDGRPDLLVLGVAARSLTAEELAALLTDLSFAAGEREVVVDVATRAQLVAERLADARLPSQVALAVAGVSSEAISLASAVGSEQTRRNAERWLSEFSHLTLSITGDDLLAAGIPEGPAIGAGLGAARAAMLDGEAETSAAQLAAALIAARKRVG